MKIIVGIAHMKAFEEFFFFLFFISVALLENLLIDHCCIVQFHIEAQ